MTSKQEIEIFLKELKEKIKVFGIVFLDNRRKNQETLLDLEISPDQRKEIIQKLIANDYYEGPITETMREIPSMWIFGKIVKQKEIYIKISMGMANNSAVCISFHTAKHPLEYPFKN